MKKDKFVVIKDIVINIRDIVSIEYIRYNNDLYIRLRNIEEPMIIKNVFNMDYIILLDKLKENNNE